MTAISIRELNGNISKVIARVERGEALAITRNGRIVAEIRPPMPARDAAWQEAYAKSDAFLRKGVSLGGGSVSDDDRYGDAEL